LGHKSKLISLQLHQTTLRLCALAIERMKRFKIKEPEPVAIPTFKNDIDRIVGIDLYLNDMDDYFNDLNRMLDKMSSDLSKLNNNVFNRSNSQFLKIKDFRVML
jgi:hypothetical protein